MVDLLIPACLIGAIVLRILGEVSEHVVKGKKWEEALTRFLVTGAFSLAFSSVILAIVEKI